MVAAHKKMRSGQNFRVGSNPFKISCVWSTRTDKSEEKKLCPDVFKFLTLSKKILICRCFINHSASVCWWDCAFLPKKRKRNIQGFKAKVNKTISWSLKTRTFWNKLACDLQPETRVFIKNSVISLICLCSNQFRQWPRRQERLPYQLASDGVTHTSESVPLRRRFHKNLIFGCIEHTTERCSR